MSVTALVLALAVAQGTPAAGVGGAVATADLVIEAGQSPALTAPVDQPLQHTGSAREDIDGAVDYCSDFYQWGGYGGVIASWKSDTDQYGDFIVGKHQGDSGLLIPWKALG